MEALQVMHGHGDGLCEPLPTRIESPKATLERPWEYRWRYEYMEFGGGFKTESRGRWVGGYESHQAARAEFERWAQGQAGTTRIWVSYFERMTAAQAKRENAKLKATHG